MGFFYIGDDVTVAGAKHGDDVAVVVAGGEIDYAASPQLKQRLANHIDAGIRRLVLDLTMVTFIDSTTISALLATAISLHELGGGSLAIVCAEENTRVQRILEIAGVDSLIAVHRTRAEALSELAAAG